MDSYSAELFKRTVCKVLELNNLNFLGMLKVISLGLGVQSTVLYYMSSLGEFPRADYAIFADTGREKASTMEYLKFLYQWADANNGIPILVISDKNLYTDMLKKDATPKDRFTPIPAFTKGADGSVGMLRRKCTGDYKIDQVNKAIRKLYNLKPRQRMPQTEVWKGITIDEIERLTLPWDKWRRDVYPFVNYMLAHDGVSRVIYGETHSRQDCIAWLEIEGLPVPQKSSCVFCPYQNDEAWFEMKSKTPADFAAAVEVDKSIRDRTAAGIVQPLYLHRSCMPLDEIVFDPADNGLFGECSGNCHL